MTADRLKTRFVELATGWITQDPIRHEGINQLVAELTPFVSRLALCLPEICDIRYAAGSPIPYPYRGEREEICRLMRSGNSDEDLSLKSVTESRLFITGFTALNNTQQFNAYLESLNLSTAQAYGILALTCAERAFMHSVLQDMPIASVGIVNAIVFTAVSHFFDGGSYGMIKELDHIVSIMLPAMATN